MILIIAVDHVSIAGGHDVYVPYLKAEDERSAHRILVEVQPNLAHLRFWFGANCRSHPVAAASSWAMSASISARFA
jgi:hypothetical protein